MKYLIVSLLNLIYGLLLLTTFSLDTPGLYLMVFIAAVVTILGLFGFILSLKHLAQPGSQAPLILKSWFQIVKGIDVLLILGLLFRAFVFQPFLVDGRSMEPNYHDKEFLMVDRITYRFAPPQRGEVIIFRSPKNPSEDYIKRIIGLPGETIRIVSGQVFINDIFFQEDYLESGTLTLTSSNGDKWQKTLGPDEYFVMGDNRTNSSDSREWGDVPKKDIIGRAWFIILPFQDFGKIKNPYSIY